MLTVQNAKELVEQKLEKKKDKGVLTTVPKITTSQLRKFLSAVNVLSAKVNLSDKEELSNELISEVQYLRVKLAYQAGRFKEVLDFVQKSNLDEEINKIKTKSDYLNFARYMEAVIAYHKFNKGE